MSTKVQPHFPFRHGDAEEKSCSSTLGCPCREDSVGEVTGRCQLQICWQTLTHGRWQSGTPRRGRSDRPPLTNDPGWDWDGTRILFSEKTVLPNREERDCEVCRSQLQEDDSPTLSGRTHVTLSLLNIARYQATKRRSKGRTNILMFCKTSQCTSNYSKIWPRRFRGYKNS